MDTGKELLYFMPTSGPARVGPGLRRDPAAGSHLEKGTGEGFRDGFLVWEGVELRGMVCWMPFHSLGWKMGNGQLQKIYIVFCGCLL